MCWEQSRLKRTIPTSRSDDNRYEPETETTRRTQDLARATNLKNPRLRPALPLRSHLEENRFRLTNSFRNGPKHECRKVRRGVFSLGVVRGANWSAWAARQS